MMNNYYLGVDVSKGYADFIILDSGRNPVEDSFQFDDTAEGHSRMYERLERFFENHPDSQIFSAVESTGSYENNWLNFLIRCGETLKIKTARLNPFCVSMNSKADLKRNTTDPVSARNIAEFLIAHPEKAVFGEDDPLKPFRKQWTFIQMLTKQKTQIFNQLEKLLYCANPELLPFCKDGIPEWVLSLMIRYPTAADLSKASVKTVSKIPYVTRQRSEELISTARKSAASETGEVTGRLIAAAARQILYLKAALKEQVDLLIQQCPMPEIELLKTFTGIGDYSAIGLLLEMYPMPRFDNVKKLSAFFGLHPVVKISGDGSAAPRMSKQGRKAVRQILFMVTLNAIVKNPLIKSIYEERVEKGMSKMAAIGYCMHKTLRIIYGMLKHNKPFDPEIDRKNRLNKDRQPATAPDKSRRYQDYDSKAPVSGRQARKRKERKATLSGSTASVASLAQAPT